MGATAQRAGELLPIAIAGGQRPEAGVSCDLVVFRARGVGEIAWWK